MWETQLIDREVVPTLLGRADLVENEVDVLHKPQAFLHMQRLTIVECWSSTITAHSFSNS